MNSLDTSTDRLRILIIDNKPNVLKDLSDILKAENYVVKAVSGKGTALIQSAHLVASSFRPHIIVVDLRLMDDDLVTDKSGLSLLESFDSAKCILYSGYLSSDITRYISQYSYVTWVDKAESPQKLLDVIKEKAERVCATERQVSLNVNARWSQMVVHALLGKKTNAPNSLVEDAIAQLFPESREISLEALDQSIVTPQSVSRGRSVLMKVFHDSRIEPLILKIATSEAIQREASNYDNHIRENLIGQFNARLNGSPAIFWDLGVLLYSLINHPNKNLITFREFYEKHSDSREIIKPLDHFFTSTWVGLYKKAVPSDETLPDFYEKVFHLSDRLKGFPNKDDQLSFPGINLKLTNPIPWLLKHSQESSVIHFRQSITHGDLHADNIIVDSNYAWAIDFERSGPGHNLRDFIELEVDIFTRLIEENISKGENIKELFLLGMILADNSDPFQNNQLRIRLTNPIFLKALNTIRELRLICMQTTQFSDFREYLWGMLFDLAFLATLAEENKTQRDRTLLLGAIVCQRIRDGFNEAWPPPAWLTVYDSISSSLNMSSNNISSSLEPQLLPSSEVPVTNYKPGVSRPVLAILIVLIMMGIVLVVLWGVTKINPSFLVLSSTLLLLLPLVIIFAFVVLGLAKGDYGLQVVRDIILHGLRRLIPFSKEKDLSDEDSPKK